jgi:hypothetical protein
VGWNQISAEQLVISTCLLVLDLAPPLQLLNYALYRIALSSKERSKLGKLNEKSHRINGYAQELATGMKKTLL